MCDTCAAHAHEHKHGDEHQAHGPAQHARGDEFRVVVTGKGGVGKTTLTAMLARRMARRGYRVLALDADPQMNLPYALGIETAGAASLTPLSENVDYVEEKTGVRPGEGWGLFFRLNPEVDDVVDRFGVRGPDGVRMLVMGNTVQPAAGCLCPENALLASVANAMSLRHDEAILMDTQAGFEHFGRALARGFRHAVVVTDPTFNGLQVALRAARLARGLGIEAIHLVVNRAINRLDFDRTLRRLDAEGGFPFASRHWLPMDPLLPRVEPTIGPLIERRPTAFDQRIEGLLDKLLPIEELVRECVS
jgi:CO dehydrogenase maturation factor